MSSTSANYLCSKTFLFFVLLLLKLSSVLSCKIVLPVRLAFRNVPWQVLSQGIPASGDVQSRIEIIVLWLISKQGLKANSMTEIFNL